jgi:LuxR family maltose regulon positive regulatory protein
MPEIAAAQVLALLRQGDVAAAALVAGAHELPLSQARVHLAQGDPTAALAVLEPYRRRMAEKAWADEELKAVVLLAVAFQAHGEHVKAAQLLDEALALAEPGGFIRIFADEGGPMARLLYDACSRGAHQGYVRQVLAAFHVDATDEGPSLTSPAAGTRLAEPLSARELEVLALIAEGLTNQEIAARLYLSLHTVKAHARNIYAKLDVSSRTQAAAKGRALGLLAPGRNLDS